EVPDNLNIFIENLNMIYITGHCLLPVPRTVGIAVLDQHYSELNSYTSLPFVMLILCYFSVYRRKGAASNTAQELSLVFQEIMS
uniref:Uncharacterized protein n=1 Tax=Aegilops tauschii subsp. strangulata TaxID=200361 RepID=A0A453DG36_AEGTS